MGHLAPIINSSATNSMTSSAKPFAVTRFDGDDVKVLNRYETYDQADAAYVRYCEKFPNACIDIDDLRSL